MYERFTEPARMTVVLSQDEARNLKREYIGGEHILLGLLVHKENLAARVLESLGLTVDRVRADEARIVGPTEEAVRFVGSSEEVKSTQIPFTPRAAKVVKHALHEAKELGHNYVGPEHILLALVCESEGIAARILLDSGVYAKTVRREIEVGLRGAKG